MNTLFLFEGGISCSGHIAVRDGGKLFIVPLDIFIVKTILFIICGLSCMDFKILS